MNLQPISPGPYTTSGSVFHACCSQCGRSDDSSNLAADLDGEPFTFVCFFCAGGWAGGAWDRIQAEYNRAFEALSAEAKHALRVLKYGATETRRIEARPSR